MEDKNYLPFSVILFLVAIIFQDHILKFITFIASGTLVGLFYGAHNNEIWKSDRPAPYEKIHNYWVHFIGGVVAGTSAYFLLTDVSFNDSAQIFNSLGWPHLILFLIMVLGYAGYIPRTLWFIANKGVR